MPIAITCPACSAALRMDRALPTGAQIRCSRCSAVFPFRPSEGVPLQAPAQPPAAATEPKPQATAPLARIVAAVPGMPSAPAAIPLGWGGNMPPAQPSAGQPLPAAMFRRRSIPRPAIYALVAAGIVVVLGFVAGGVFVLRAGSPSVARATGSVRATTSPVAATERLPATTSVRPPSVAIRPPAPAAPAVANRKQDWLKRTLLSDYDRVGRKDPRWDADAREVLRLTAESWNNRFRELAAINAAHDRASRAGCSDALVLYAAGKLWGVGALRPDLIAQALEKTPYHAAHRCLALLRGSRFAATQGNPDVAGRFLQSAMKLVPEAAADAELPSSVFLEICDDLEGCYIALLGDRKAAFEKVDAVLAAARPESSLLYTYRGFFYIHSAWDARGSDWANNVTDEGWRLFGKRLEQAETLLEKAWQLDGNNADAARAMLSVELGQGKGRERMELWFRRAMTADPDNYDACKAKVYYLEPKWHGSPEAMLEFGRECLRGGNWKARLPLILPEAHEAIAAYNRANPDAYFTTPAVWQDIQAAYEPYLNACPKASLDRSRYAFLACRCGQWAVAQQQFALLGKDAQPSVFGSRERFEEMRKEAARRAS